MKIGDKVVCVDVEPCEGCGYTAAQYGLTLGAVYVLSDFIHKPFLDARYRGRVKAVGCKWACGCVIDDNFLPAFQFRKLDEIKSELAALMGKPEKMEA